MILAIHTIVWLLIEESHFILLHSALKRKKVYYQFKKSKFSIPFPLVLCFWSKGSGYTRLGKMDFQRPVCAVKKNFQFVPYLNNAIVHGEVALNAERFCILPVFPKGKVIADVHRNVGLVQSVIIGQGKSLNCNKPVITLPLGRLANLSCPHVIN